MEKKSEQELDQTASVVGSEAEIGDQTEATDASEPATTEAASASEQDVSSAAALDTSETAAPLDMPEIAPEAPEDVA